MLDVHKEVADRKKRIHSILHEEGISAFGEVNVAWNIDWGILNFIQAHGMGSLESNTILLGYPDELKRLTFLVSITHHLKSINRSLIIGKIEQLRPHREGVSRIIHVWWGGLKRNSDLMLMLAEVDYKPVEGALTKRKFNRIFGDFLGRTTARVHTEANRVRKKLAPEVHGFWRRVRRRCRR